jgi:hypothetical protein
VTSRHWQRSERLGLERSMNDRLLDDFALETRLITRTIL